MSQSRPIRVRMAPSPTGHLHVGTAYPALFNYLFAKGNQGVFILRNEDTDPERSKTEFVHEIIVGLKWLGLHWDEGVDLTEAGELTERGAYGPYSQTQRTAIYRTYLEKLLTAGSAYWCYCTKEELDAERARQEAAGLPPKYAGTCRTFTEAPAGKEPQVIRFKTPEKIITFTDVVRGEIKTDATLYGDLVIARSLDSVLYNFAVVVDDMTMEISHVIRGEDHISNTPKQVMLFEAFDYTPPLYAHLSLILAPDRTKLSKRRNKVSLLAYRDEGFLPETMCNFLALLGWHLTGDQEFFTMNELIASFSLDRLQKSGAVFDEAKLRWLNREHMKALEVGDLAARVGSFLPEGVHIEEATLKRYAVAEQGRADTLLELAQAASWIFAFVDPGQEMLIPKDATPEETLTHLQGACKVVSASSGDTWLEEVTAWLNGRAETYSKRGVFHPVRVALSGAERSPDPMTLMQVLGREESLRRLELALTKF